ncbi:AraC-like ligand-binding domain-containing protein [Gordonia rubripertincta]|nr:helix-turn-helix domain-containing protein [Gordonia rubripertincta]
MSMVSKIATLGESNGVSDCPSDAGELLSGSGGRAWWTDTLSEMYCEMDPQWYTERGRFHARLTGRDFGNLYLSTVRADGHAVVRTPAMISDVDHEDFFLCAVTGGPGTVTQHGRSVVLDKGDFTVVDSGQPYRFDFPCRFAQTVVRIPRPVMHSRVRESDLDAAILRRVAGTSGAGAVVSRFLEQIAAHGTELDSPESTALAESAMDMIVVALTAAGVPQSTTTRAHIADYRRAQTYLRARLGDSSLTVAGAASELGMSTRYLQKLFAADGTTPREWLVRARLERARSLLVTSDITVAALTGEVGFKESSHFSRSFTDEYGLSPGRYRRLGPLTA